MKIDILKTVQTESTESQRMFSNPITFLNPTIFCFAESMEKIFNDFVVQCLDITTVPIEQFVEDTPICFRTLAQASQALSPGLGRKLTRIFRAK